MVIIGNFRGFSLAALGGYTIDTMSAILTLKQHRALGNRCLHCGVHKVHCGGGLCYRCHSIPSVRAQYPVVWNNRDMACGVADFATDGPLPAEPTNALPGTLEKVLVMQARAAGGEKLFHPDDAAWDGEGCIDLDTFIMADENRERY